MRILTQKEFQDDMAKEWSKAVEAEYKDQIEEAVLAEREACARICDEWPNGRDDIWEIGNAIRARGQA